MTNLGDLVPDPKNARRHNPRNVGMIEQSIQKDGFGRSLLLDAANTILAGNATAEAAASAGLEDVLIVDSDGTKVIAIRRTDIAPGSKEALRLSVGDNRAAELADWDADVLDELNTEIDLSSFFFEGELAQLLQQVPSFDPAAEWGGMPEFDIDDTTPMKQVVVSFASERDLELFARLVEQKITMDTKSIWFPAKHLESIRDKRYAAAEE